MDSNNMTIECPIDKATNIFSKKIDYTNNT